MHRGATRGMTLILQMLVVVPDASLLQFDKSPPANHNRGRCHEFDGWPYEEQAAQARRAPGDGPLSAVVANGLKMCWMPCDGLAVSMFPTLFGCRTAYELIQLRVWDKNLPGRILGALPKQTWIRQLQRRGQALLIRLWQRVADKSPATQSRWQWTWAADHSVCKKAGQQLGLVGPWESCQEHRVRLGIDGLLLVVVGDGKLVVPVDFVIRRPYAVGPGHPCRDTLTWLQVMLDRTWAVLQRRYVFSLPDGHLVLRYTARFCLQGRVTREEIVFSLKHHWRFLNSELQE